MRYIVTDIADPRVDIATACIDATVANVSARPPTGIATGGKVEIPENGRYDDVTCAQDCRGHVNVVGLLKTAIKT